MAKARDKTFVREEKYNSFNAINTVNLSADQTYPLGTFRYSLSGTQLNCTKLFGKSGFQDDRERVVQVSKWLSLESFKFATLSYQLTRVFKDAVCNSNWT